jgi:hypothetical protein
VTRLFEQTLNALEQLTAEELETLVTHALKLRTSRYVPHLSSEETRMLEQIRNAIPTDVQAHFAGLLDKRDALTLTDDEHGELIGLTDVIENLEAKRVSLLGELARYRGVRLEQVMQDLGINTPALRIAPNFQNTDDLNAFAIADLLGLSKGEIAKYLGDTVRGLTNNPASKRAQPHLQRLHAILERIRDLFADRSLEHARMWLKAPHPTLGHRTPMTLLLEGHADAVEDVLTMIETGQPD